MTNRFERVRGNFWANTTSPASPPIVGIRWSQRSGTIRRVRVQRTSSSTTIEFDGDGFLYKMVRLMVGAIVRCGLGKTSLAEVRVSLLNGTPAEPRLVAPADGLTLVRVRY